MTIYFVRLYKDFLVRCDFVSGIMRGTSFYIRDIVIEKLIFERSNSPIAASLNRSFFPELNDPARPAAARPVPWARGGRARGRSAGQTNRHGESVDQEVHPYPATRRRRTCRGQQRRGLARSVWQAAVRSRRRSQGPTRDRASAVPRGARGKNRRERETGAKRRPRHRRAQA